MIASIIAVVSAACCGGSPAAPDSIGSETLALRLTTEHCRLWRNLNVNVVHEFCHAVSLSVSSTFANNPRWLWETVALYENGELVPPRTLDYLVRGAYPSLADLNADPNAGRQIYELGYVIGEFIVAHWGRAGLLDLIRAHGDVNAVFGRTPAAFEMEMYAWIRTKYL